AASVVGMAGGTVIGKMCQRFCHHVGGARNRGGRITSLDRDGQMTDLACQEHLDWVGLHLGTKAGREHLIPHPSERTDNPEAHHGDEDDQFCSHGYPHALYKVFCLIATGVTPSKRPHAALRGETSAMR